MTEPGSAPVAAARAGSGVSADKPYVDPARVRYRQRKAWRDAAIGIISLIVTATVVTLIVVRTPGWSAVQETFFSPEAFSESFPGLLEAFWLNVRIFLIAEPLILIVGLTVALVRRLKSPIFLPLRIVAVDAPHADLAADRAVVQPRRV